jgi:diguanylate cyclase (GGDEF)-like protein/PAS domain S-box-containing protein
VPADRRTKDGAQAPKALSSTAADEPKAPHGSPAGGRLARLPISGQLRAISLVFVAMLIGLVLLGAVGMLLLSGIRAYVGGEGLWSKGQKDATLYLLRYATTHNQKDYEAYQDSLAVPLGDRLARLELQKPWPDYAIVQRGFVQGGNSPADTPITAFMFVAFKGFGYMKAAIGIWQQADGYITRLQALGSLLHQEVVSGHASQAQITGVVEQIQILNQELEPVEDAFSSILGRAARWLANLLISLMFAAAGLFLAFGLLFSATIWRILKERLARLQGAAARIASGDLSGRVAVEVRDEVGSLAATFNQMADSLALSKGEVEQKARELAAALEERQKIMETVPDLLYLIDLDGRLVRWNRHLETVSGLSGEELLGRPVVDLFTPEDRPIIAGALRGAYERGRVQVEGRVIGPDGAAVPYELTGVPLKDDQGNVVGLAGAGRDIGQRKAFEEQLTHRAFHDVLTSLPNRALFFNRLEQALARADRRSTCIAVLFVDVDRFKTINDSLGHDVGDQILVEVSRRLESCMRPGDTVARLGGDEFSVLIEDTAESEATALAQRITETLHQPYMVAGKEVFVTASVGICLNESGREEPDDLLRRADLAMYESKRTGKGRHTMFESAMSARVVERFNLENDLRRVIERGELRVFYQPLVLLETGGITEMEALVRWEHPTRGLLLPGAFIPLAEETGLIVAIGRWVLEEACREVRLWRGDDAGEEPVVIGVNLSTGQFQDPGLVDDVQRVLRETGIEPRLLKLEITESTVMSNEKSAIETLHRLKEVGVRLAIDDFGTGYSSLAYIRRLPVDDIKLDRSFVRNLGHDQEDAAIVRSVVELASALNLNVTAEGIETPEALEQVKALGCHHGQGFYIGRPVPASDMRERVLYAKSGLAEGTS